jgi:hypothetical protein
MGLKPRRKGGGTQTGLAFEYDPTGREDEMTAFGGLPVFVEAMMALGVQRSVGANVHVRQRQSGYSEADLTETICMMQAAGGDRLEDVERLGLDKALVRLLDKDKLASPDALRRFLLEFHDEELIAQAKAQRTEGEKSYIVQESEPLQGLGNVLADTVRRMQQINPVKVATLEMDATIIESHKRDALTHYKGGRGYQPAVVYWVEHDAAVADEFRDGNVPAGKHPIDVVKKAFAAVPQSVEQRRFRADSAAYEEESLKWLADPSNRIERFTVSADMGEQLHKLCVAVPETGWSVYEERFAETVYWGEVEFVTGDWNKDAKPLRTLVLRVQKHQGELFSSGSDRKYLGIVSNDFETPGADLIKWHYAKAGCIEILHDVVKNELGGGVLPCGAFGANAAWFRLSLITYNALSFLKTVGAPPSLRDARPKRLRYSMFSIPAKIVMHARSLFAKVSETLSKVCDLSKVRIPLRELIPIPLVAST